MNVPFRYTRLAIFFIGVTCLFIVVSLLPWQTIDGAKSALSGENISTSTTPVFQSPTLEAKGAVVYDPESDTVIYGKAESAILPLASITKLMTALVSSDVLTDQTIITITTDDLTGGSNAGLEAGRSWKYPDLVDFMLTTSSNGAATAIGRVAGIQKNVPFVAQMNEKARDLKLPSLIYRNETGLDVSSGTPGAKGSARDVAKLVAYISKHKPELLESTRFGNITRTTTDGGVISGNNTNLIVRTIPGFMGSKTGYTELAGGNLAVAFDAGLGKTIIVVVLGSSQDGRFRDVQKLITETLKVLAK